MPRTIDKEGLNLARAKRYPITAYSAKWTNLSAPLKMGIFTGDGVIDRINTTITQIYTGSS